MSAGGSIVSSRNASNSDVPGGVFRTHGDCRVPDPLTFAFAITSSLLLRRYGKQQVTVSAYACTGLAGPDADRGELQRNVDQEQFRNILRLDAQRRLVLDLGRIAGREFLGPNLGPALHQAEARS